MDSNDCVWTPRIEATIEAQKRSRIAFIALIIVSLAFIIANWNASLSWEKFIAFKNKFGVEMKKDGSKDLTKDDKEKVNKVLKESQKILLEEWVRSQTISVPFLGLHIGHSDGAVLGSFSLLIISLWFYLSMRRENEIIGTLLRDSQDKSQEIRSKIFYGVTSYLLFSNFGQGRPIIDSLEKSTTENGTQHETPKYTRFIFRILLFLPTIAVLFIIISDILSIFFLRAPFRSPQVPLIELAEFKEKWFIALIMESIALLALIFIANFGYQALKNEEGTEKLLIKYENLLNKENSEGKNI